MAHGVTTAEDCAELTATEICDSPAMPTPDQYLTYIEAAEQFGISDSTLRRRVKAGKLTAHRTFRDARRVLLSRRELEEVATMVKPAD